MTLLQVVRERLLAVTPLTTLVAQRVYPSVLPQNERRSSVVVQGISRNAEQQMRGPVGIVKSRVQIDSYVTVADSSDPSADAEAIAEAIHGDGLGPGASGLFGFSGDLGGSPASIRVLNVRLAGWTDPFYDHDNEVERMRVMQQYFVDWKPL